MKKSEAIEKGLVFYEADNPCTVCNSTRRRVDSGGCYQCKRLRARRASKARNKLARIRFDRHKEIILGMNGNGMSPARIVAALEERGMRIYPDRAYTESNIISIILQEKKHITNPDKFARRDVIKLPPHSKRKEQLFNFKPDDLGEMAAW